MQRRPLLSLFCSLPAIALATIASCACTSPDENSASAPPREDGGSGNGSGGGGSVVEFQGGGPGEVDPCDALHPPDNCLMATRPACGDGNLDWDSAASDCGGEFGADNPNIVENPAFSVAGVCEQCDDGNSLPGDGCSGTCVIEPNFICPTAGEPCESTIICGDGTRASGEFCDDGNTVDGDGCSAACTLVEPGYICPAQGEPCVLLEVCGDGRVAGAELCDDGNVQGDDGCSPWCQWEDGWLCDGAPGQYNCSATVCGDGVKGNTEACDDGNLNGGDGCSGTCQNEPNCSGVSGCTSACGDGLVIGDELCDDGNGVDGDGCNSACQLEAGFTCGQPPTGTEMTVPVVYRDFTPEHPNFEPNFSPDDVVQAGMVMNLLGPNGKPQFVDLGTVHTYTSNAEDFGTWFTETPACITYAETMTLLQDPAAPENYIYEAPAFFPLDNRGWVEAGNEATVAAQIPPPYGNWEAAGQHNFYFTSEVRYWFEFNGNHRLLFTGDDDVWVFVNGQLAVDLGGIHTPKTGEILLNEAWGATFGLELGRVYEIAVFQAERHKSASSYRLTLSGFNTSPTDCVSQCGDGVITLGEECDDGINDGSYGGCMPDCTRGPHCGDGIPQPQEACDDGVNDGGYGECAPGCMLGPHCGDGVTDADHEECDDGVNDGGYGECDVGCVLGPYCGDGTLNSPQEDCDDGNTRDHDGCSAACATEVSIK